MCELLPNIFLTGRGLSLFIKPLTPADMHMSECVSVKHGALRCCFFLVLFFGILHTEIFSEGKQL